jgi:5-methylcytosine-specific restriction endonuclease McrA
MTDPTNSKYRYIGFKSNQGYRRYVQEDEDKSLQAYGSLTKDVTIPAHGSYGALLFDPRWKARRKLILQRDAHSCVICQSKTEVQVHHRQYHFIIRSNEFKPPWDYADHLLITLCESCHNRGHSKYKVPTIIL